MRKEKFEAINGWELIENDGMSGFDRKDNWGRKFFWLDNVKMVIDAPADGDIEKAIREELIGMYGEPKNEGEREDHEAEVKDFVKHAKMFGNLLAVIGSDRESVDVIGTLDDFVRWGLTIDRDNVILTMNDDVNETGEIRTAVDNYGNTYRVEADEPNEWHSFIVYQIDGEWHMNDFDDELDFKEVKFK